jgi:anti-sigma factor RsiW
MSLTKNELLYLMAYADGEVDDDEIPEVLALIEKSEEARRVLEQQAALRQWTLDSAESLADKGRASRIADLVMAEIEEQGGAKLITLERERVKRALNQQRVKEFSALAAVAAVVALFYLWPNGTETSDKPAAVAAESAHAVPSAPPSSAAPAGPNGAPQTTDTPAAVASSDTTEEPSIDIQAVESPQHQFSIFYVPGATGANAHASSVVVWIGEE